MVLKEGFHNISSLDYHMIDMASSHRLGLLKRSPAHLKYSIDFVKAPTKALIIGEAIHTAVLEPEIFLDTYAELPKFDARTKEGKAKRDEFTAQAGLRTVLDQDDYRTVVNTAQAVLSHPQASLIIASATDKETTGIFKDPATGVMCKMRIDGICKDLGIIIDLKTTLDASENEFKKSIFNFGYDRQAAFYVHGCETLGIKITDYLLIAVEKEPPYALRTYRVLDEVIQEAKKENEKLLSIYAECLKNNSWPSYPNFITDIGLPTWAKKQIERSIYV